MVGKHHDLVDFTKKYKAELHDFYLDMKSWSNFSCNVALHWKKLPFGDASHPAIPHERGIYVFTVEAGGDLLPPHGYILYVGISGEDHSRENLYKRYAAYLRNKKNEDGRPAVFYMLAAWPDNLFFHWAALPNAASELRAIESAFIDAVKPPVNKRDFDASVTAARAAAF